MSDNTPTLRVLEQQGRWTPPKHVVALSVSCRVNKDGYGGASVHMQDSRSEFHMIRGRLYRIQNTWVTYESHWSKDTLYTLTCNKCGAYLDLKNGIVQSNLQDASAYGRKRVSIAEIMPRMSAPTINREVLGEVLPASPNPQPPTATQTPCDEDFGPWAQVQSSQPAKQNKPVEPMPLFREKPPF